MQLTRKIRVAKFTHDGYNNYGMLLQSYALQQVLRRYNIEVHSIWSQRYNFLPETWWNWNWKEPIKYYLNWKGFRSKMKSGKIGWEMAWETRMRDFADRYIDYRRDVDLSTIDCDYDYCVVGSDQVWNPSWGDFWQFFLDFVPKEKRISYAASISVPDIPDNIKDRFAEKLKGMKTLSLREHAGAELVEKLTGRSAAVHVDPTLLLTAEEWRLVSREPSWVKETCNGYLLTYFLGRKPEEIERIAKGLGLKVINLLDEHNYLHYVTGVDEFLWAIDHASLLYTDSFHGSVFSILFRTPFVVCNRIGSETEEKMSSRVDTLLGYFGLESRRGVKDRGYAIDNPLKAPDWSKVDEVLAIERARSDKYLRKALGIA